MYKDVANNIERFNIKYPNTIVPKPTDNDYKIGFIRRYFVRRSNDPNGHIFEVNQSVYNEYSKNPFWVGDTIKWRIAGPLDAVYDRNGNLQDKGVRNSNKGGMSLVSDNLKNISLYLPNLLQFYKA